jgi:hypothetical protein
MTWQEAKDKAENQGNIPSNIKEWEKADYIRYQTEVFFNEFHKINDSYCEWCRNAKHMIIANCLYRTN